MNSILETFEEFWEILTGVFDDNKAKLIRFTCFALLALGGMWAAFNYFRADMLADTNIEIHSNSEIYTRNVESPELRRMAELAKTVQTMRQGGEAIATAIATAHSKPFNIEGYNEMGLENLGQGGVNLSSANNELNPSISISVSGDVPQVDEFQPPAILVKAVMLSGKNHSAIIDMQEEKGILIRQGGYLPDKLGRVTKIRPNNITVKFDGREVVYEVPEIENKLKKKKANANNTNNNNQKKLGVEKFLFEGTVPKDSPLAPTVSQN